MSTIRTRRAPAPTAHWHTSPGCNPGRTTRTNACVLKERRVSSDGQPTHNHAPCGVPSERVDSTPPVPGVAPRAGMRGPVGAKTMPRRDISTLTNPMPQSLSNILLHLIFRSVSAIRMQRAPAPTAHWHTSPGCNPGWTTRANARVLKERRISSNGQPTHNHAPCGVPSERVDSTPPVPGVAPRAGMRSPVGAKTMPRRDISTLTNPMPQSLSNILLHLIFRSVSVIRMQRAPAPTAHWHTSPGCNPGWTTRANARVLKERRVSSDGQPTHNHAPCGVPSERVDSTPPVPGVAPRAGMRGPIGAKIPCPVGASAH
jgi:hypothetical protein